MYNKCPFTCVNIISVLKLRSHPTFEKSFDTDGTEEKYPALECKNCS